MESSVEGRGRRPLKASLTVSQLLSRSPLVLSVCVAFLQVNLTELKAFPNPPNAVTNVTAAVMVLLAPRGRVPKDRSWKAAKVFMGKVSDNLAR